MVSPIPRISYDELRIVDTILSMNNRISITSLTRMTGFSRTKILMLLRKIRKKIAFFTKVNWTKIGLIKLILILDRPWPWDELIYPDSITNISESYEGKQVISYLIPISSLINNIIDFYGNSVREYMFLDHIVYPNYRFLRYFHNGRIEFDISSLLENVLDNTSYSVNNRSIRINMKHYYKISELDVKILNKIFVNPFISTRRIAEELGERYDRVRRHLDLLFKREIIEGYFVGGTNIFGKLLFGMVVHLKLDDVANARIIARALSNIPLFSLIYYNSKGEMIINIPVYKDLLLSFQKIPRIFKNRFGNRAEIYVMSLERKYKFDVNTKMYNKYARSFVLE